MKIIKLNPATECLVDDEDYELVSRFKWHCHKSNSKHYAATDLGTFGKPLMLYMHRLLFKPGKFERIDHINGNGLDNTRANLRIATAQQNLMNRGAPKNNKSGFKGVSFNKRSGKWRASIAKNRKWMFLGLFDDKREAALAYDKAARNLFGEFAYTNLPKES